MSEVFVSYARPDEPQAKRVAEALRSLGYHVWRDDELPAHRPYSDVIEERLRSAKAVVVLWSAEAAKSQWVRAEADTARGLGTLVQAVLDAHLPPLPFNQIQCADLVDWNGSEHSAGWEKLVSSVAALAGDQSPKESRSRPRGTSVCVLPFQNMSGDPEQEYFSDGISEDITTDLSKISALEVIARNTAFTFKGKAVDVCEVARKLGVSHVLEGSVRKASARVRVTAQLIDGLSGGHVWADRYDRDLTDIFAIQDEISKAIVDALKLKLLPREKQAIESRGTTNAEAYNLYLLARQYWITGDFGDRRREERVIRICGRATDVDPDYPQAWALMALAQANLRYAYTGDREADDGAAAAERALALDPTIAEAHLPRAWRLAVLGCDDEANEEITTALRLNPDSWEVNKEVARLLYRQRNLAEATRHLEMATDLMESDFHGWGMLAACYLAQGNSEGLQRCADKLTGQIEKALARDPDNGSALAFGALAFAVIGEMDRAREYIDRSLLLDPDNLYMRYNLAWPLLAYFKDEDTALEMIEPALAKAGRNLVRLAVSDPNLDGLRDNPKFQAMLSSAAQRVGLGTRASIPASAT
ncbi:MAG TPA: TIR domain-containing protein [Sphingomicrobium sp.]|nr:TIR domain-containing protein [Sphingomicrobium sp.]